MTDWAQAKDEELNPQNLSAQEERELDLHIEEERELTRRSRVSETPSCTFGGRVPGSSTFTLGNLVLGIGNRGLGIDSLTPSIPLPGIDKILGIAFYIKYIKYLLNS